MSYNPQTREQAVEAALRLGKCATASDLIREAKLIEAYLEGKEDDGAIKINTTPSVATFVMPLPYKSETGDPVYPQPFTVSGGTQNAGAGQ